MTRVAIVSLGRGVAMGEVRRVASWRQIFHAAGAEVVEVALAPTRHPHADGIVPVLAGRAAPERLAWSGGRLRDALRAERPDAVVVVSTRAYDAHATEGPWTLVLDQVDSLSRSYRDRAEVVDGLSRRVMYRSLAAAHRRVERRMATSGVRRVAAGWKDARALDAEWVPNVIDADLVPVTDVVADHDVLFFGTLRARPTEPSTYCYDTHLPAPPRHHGDRAHPRRRDGRRHGPRRAGCPCRDRRPRACRGRHCPLRGPLGHRQGTPHRRQPAGGWALRDRPPGRDAGEAPVRRERLADPHRRPPGGARPGPASATSGLQALRAEIDGDTSVDAVREDVRRISEDYRVYALVSRQVALVTAVDTVGVAADRSTASAEDLEAAIDEAEANGKDVGDARTHLATMIASIDTAEAAVDGTAAAVLALTPAAWNAGDAQPVLRDARESLKDARAALRKALAAARAILADLR